MLRLCCSDQVGCIILRFRSPCVACCNVGCKTLRSSRRLRWFPVGGDVVSLEAEVRESHRPRTRSRRSWAEVSCRSDRRPTWRDNWYRGKWCPRIDRRRNPFLPPCSCRKKSICKEEEEYLQFKNVWERRIFIHFINLGFISYHIIFQESEEWWVRDCNHDSKIAEKIELISRDSGEVWPAGESKYICMHAIKCHSWICVIIAATIQTHAYMKSLFNLCSR